MVTITSWTSTVALAGITLGSALLGSERSIGDQHPNTAAAAQCVELCKKAVAAGEDLSAGPCLSDDLPGGVVEGDTVCDVAHSPRTEEDDDPDNQCEAFRDGRANHFVEVTPTCDLIRER